MTDILPPQMDASGALPQAMEVPAEGRPLTASAAPPASDAQALFGPILGELAEFEERLEASVAADLGPMAEAMRHIVRAGASGSAPRWCSSPPAWAIR